MPRVSPLAHTLVAFGKGGSGVSCRAKGKPSSLAMRAGCSKRPGKAMTKGGDDIPKVGRRGQSQLWLCAFEWPQGVGMSDPRRSSSLTWPHANQPTHAPVTRIERLPSSLQTHV